MGHPINLVLSEMKRSLSGAVLGNKAKKIFPTGAGSVGNCWPKSAPSRQRNLHGEIKLPMEFAYRNEAGPLYDLRAER